MIWMLRLFSAYRELESRVATAELRAGQAWDWLERERKRSERLIDMLDGARKSEIESLTKVADSQARKHGGPIFDVASAIPENRTFEPVDKRKLQAADLVQMEEKKFFDALQRAAHPKAEAITQ